MQAVQQGGEEPLQPGGDVQPVFLAGFENAVVAGAVVEDARRHGVETYGLALALGQGEVGEGAGQAAVAVVERVQGDEPEVGDTGAK
ncbi:hypothetical protein D3C78_1404590 [compost metagenome]